MKKNVFRITALMAAMMMTMMSSAKTQDWGGRVIDEKGEPMPFVNVVPVRSRRQECSMVCYRIMQNIAYIW